MSGLKVFFSHRVESLYQRMKGCLFGEKTHPFARRLVVVPSPAMKNWLQQTMALDPTCEIASGFDIGFVDQTVRCLSQEINPSLVREASGLEIAVLIETLLCEAEFKKDPRWQLVFQFLGEVASSKNQKRITTLSIQLSSLFEKYGIYGGEGVFEWMGTKGSWQQELWGVLWEKFPTLIYPIKSFQNALKFGPERLKNRHTEVHIFAVSFLPALYHRFLSELSKTIPVNYYVLSPCQAFWSDIKSDRESRKLYSFWRKKGASTDQLSVLEDFLRDRNPLLANFGRLGREMAEQLESGDHEVWEDYQLPKAIMDVFPYDQLVGGDLFLEEREHPLCLLDFVQADLTLLRNPLETEKILVDSKDPSIQLHVCPTKRREVEVLYQVLMGVLDRHKNDGSPITPAEIVVMAPNLADYEPYIRCLFDQNNDGLDYQLMEVELLSHSRFVQSFLQILELANSRWDAASLLSFLESPFVQKKHGFTGEDVRKLREWILEANVCWGADDEDCKKILVRHFCENSPNGEIHSGTWEFGFNRLLTGLAVTLLGDENKTRYHPLEIVETSNAELLGRWIEFLNRLKDDINFLQQKQLLPMETWSAYLKALADAYLSVDDDDKEEVGCCSKFFVELDKLSSASREVKEHLFSYGSVRTLLDQLLAAGRVNYREGHLNAVRFCSLLPMRALPAKVVVLLGMQDGEFPRTDFDNNLDLLREEKNADFVPSRMDLDRSVFLDALLSARRYFFMFYTAFEVGKEVQSSILVKELISYLDSAYDVLGEAPSSFCVHQHPLHAFDACYFSEDALFPGYSKKAFDGALHYYKSGKKERSRFIPTFSNENILPKDVVSKALSLEEDKHNRLIVDIKDLDKMSKNPIQGYFNRSLGIYIDKVSKRYIETDEKFESSHLDLYRLKEKTLTQNVEAVIKESKKEGFLPTGLFEDVSIQKLKEEADGIQHQLVKMDVKTGDVFEIRLSAHCEVATKTDFGWFCPPLFVETTTGSLLSIEGKIKLVTSKGLLVFKGAKIEELMEVWPRYLIFRALVEKHSMPIEGDLLCLKDGKSISFDESDLKQSLLTYLEYYLRALEHVSPLLPGWTKHLFGGKEGGLEKTIKSNLGRSEDFFFNEYAKWCFSDEDSIPDANEIEVYWKPVAEQVFGLLNAALNQKKGSKAK